MLFLRTVDNQIMFSSSGLGKKYFSVQFAALQKKFFKKCGTLNQNLVNISYLCAMQTFNIIYFTDAVLQ